MAERFHSIQFETPINAAIYALAMASDYRISAASAETYATRHGLPSSDFPYELRRIADRLEDKGETVLRRLRGLHRYHIYGPVHDIQPLIENVRLAFNEANTFVLLRALDLMPERLDAFDKVQRLFDTAPDFAEGRDEQAARERTMRAMGVVPRKLPTPKDQPSLLPDSEGQT